MGWVGPSDPALQPPAGCHIGYKFPMHLPSPQPSWTFPPFRLPFRSGLTPLRTAISHNLVIQQSSKLELLTLQFQFPEILCKIMYIIMIDLFTNLQIINSRIVYFSYMRLQIYILTYQRINIPTYRRINVLNYRHIDI